MSLFTSAMLVLWMYALDQHWPDATSPVTFAIFIIYAVQDIVRSRT